MPGPVRLPRLNDGLRPVRVLSDRSKPWRELRYGQHVSAVGRVFARHNTLARSM